MNKPRTLRRSESIAELKLRLRLFVVELLVSSHSATERAGLNATDFGALCLLLLRGPTPAGHLADLTGVTTGAATGVVDRLERARLVKREADPSDRRKVIVTPDRARVESELFPHFPTLERAADSSFYDGFSISELELIARFLARLRSE